MSGPVSSEPGSVYTAVFATAPTNTFRRLTPAAMIPLLGDPRLAQALEEVLSFRYSLRCFTDDYEAARAYAYRIERVRSPEGHSATPLSPRAAEDLLASYRARYGLAGGTVRAVRCQLILVALAENWGKLTRRGLAQDETRGRMLPLRDISRSLLEALLKVDVAATSGPLSLRLDDRGVRAAIRKVSSGPA